MRTHRHFTMVDDELADRIGIKEAMIVEKLRRLLTLKGGRDIDGHHWVFNTYPQWKVSHFKSWSTRTIRRLFCRLEGMGIVASCQPDGTMSRKKYYRLNAHVLANIAGDVTPVPTPVLAPAMDVPMRPNTSLPQQEITEQYKSKESKETHSRTARTAPVTPKPDSRAFMKKRPPARFQSNAVFLKWAAAAAPNVCDKRPDVYKEFRKQNWMTRHKKTKKLVPIWNFGEFVLGLEGKLLSAPGGMP